MADLLPGMGNLMPVINPYDIASGLNLAVIAAFVLILGGVFAFFAIKKKWFVKFPTSIEIMKVENGILTTVDNDYGRRVVKKNKDGSILELYYDIKKRNFKWYPPSFESSVATKKGKSKMYVRELYPNKWEIINPAAFVTGKTEDYKRTEGDELDSYFKNTQDLAAKNRYKLPESGLDALIKGILPILPIAISVILLIVFFTQVVFPMMGQYSVGQAYLQLTAEQINTSTNLLDKSTQYVEMLMRLNGYQVVNGTAVIP
jgi:hypothetical protein